MDDLAERLIGEGLYSILDEGAIGSRPSWDESFMTHAVIASSRSSCFQVRAGAILTIDNRMAGSGYNGAPGPIENSLDRGYCTKEKMGGEEYGKSTGSGTCIGSHAERNGLSHLTNKDGEFNAYTTIFSCNDCTKDLLGYGVKRVIFKNAYLGGEMERSLGLFKEANVQVQQLDLSDARMIDILLGREARKLDIRSKDERVDLETIRDSLLQIKR